MSAGRQHKALQGESVESIAHEAGHVWQTVWNAPQNAELRKLRKLPHVIMPGDMVFVPPITLKTESIATDRHHTIRRRGVPSKLIVRFLVDGKPRANAKYSFLMLGVERRGTTDGDGVLKESIDPLAPWAEVRFDVEAEEEAEGIDDPDHEPLDEEHADDGPKQDVYRFALRHLDPLSEASGVRGRLHLLGYSVGPVDGKPDAATESALRAFQADHDLEVTGALDDVTRAKLAEYSDG